MPPAPIYLDHNATAPMLPEVADAVREAALRYPGNPASQHDLGRQARRALEAARTRIGELLGARMTGMDADRVIFTSGGTESNNLALFGLLRQSPAPIAPQHRPSLVGASLETAPRVIISAIEHPSIARTAEDIAASGVSLSILSVSRDGVANVEHLRQLLNEIFSGSLTLEGRGEERSERALRPTLVSIMLASNETGVIQPVAKAAALCGQFGALIHTDATQAVGKIDVNFQQLGVDALTATAHKVHGPLGIGVLMLRHGVTLEPTLHGGFQQAALRPGTESVALAIGMQTALEHWQREADVRRERMTTLRDQFERTILAGYAGAVIIGAAATRLHHTSNIAFVGLDRQALVMALDLAGVACSTGSACASGSTEPSPTLLAMGLPEDAVSSSIRFSLGATTTAEDIDEAARRILAVCNQLRREK